MLMAIKIGMSKIYIQSDSQIAANAMKKKMTIPKDIIYPIKDVRWLFFYFIILF